MAERGTRDDDFLYSQIFLLQQRNEDLRNEVHALFAQQQRYLQVINSNVRRIAIVPAARRVRPSAPPVTQVPGAGVGRVGVPQAVPEVGVPQAFGEFPGVGDQVQERPQPRSAVLGKPADLYLLWREWEMGLGITRQERNSQLLKGVPLLLVSTFRGERRFGMLL